jgi:hypothetical protein
VIVIDNAIRQSEKENKKVFFVCKEKKKNLLYKKLLHWGGIISDKVIFLKIEN